MKITIRKLPAIAPRGKNMGVFTNIKLESIKDASGKECNILKVMVDLEAKDPQGRAFQVQKDYNLSGHGLRFFQDDYATCFGRSLTDEELNEFDSEALLKGKRVMVQTEHKKSGKKLIPVVAAFLPSEPAPIP